jgi:hypothetical protein
MKPFEFGTKQMKNFTDCHPKRLNKLWGGKWVNWWEDRNFMKSKKARRQKDKRKLEKEIDG